MLIDALVAFIVIFGGSFIVPQFVVCDSWKTALFASIIFAIVALVLGFVVGLIASLITTVLSALRLRALAALVSLALTTFVCYVVLIVTEQCVSGFAIESFWPRVIIATLIGILTTRHSMQNKD